LDLKRNTIHYAFSRDDLNNKDVAEDVIKNYLVQSTPQGSCWWSGLSKTIKTVEENTFSSYMKRVQQYVLDNPLQSMKDTETYGSVMTAKKCPAIASILRTSFLVKSPANMTITIKEDGEFVWHSDSDIINIETHSKLQFTPEDGNNDLFKDKVNLKFVTGITLKTTKQSPWMFLQPTYHNNVDYQVLNGIVESKYVTHQALNINTLFDIPTEGTKTYHIKTGDVLSYIWFPHKMKLKHSQNNKLFRHNR